MTTEMKFYETNEFKEAIGQPNAKAKTVKNPNTGKFFIDIAGKSYKCQQDIDMNKRIVFMHSADEDISNACLVNAKDNSENVFGTF